MTYRRPKNGSKAAMIEVCYHYHSNCISAPNLTMLDNNWNFAVEILQPTSPPRVIGLIGAVRAPEIGYMFNADYWGKGYATEALRAFMPLFFEHYSGGDNERYNYAVALTDTELTSSHNVLQKAGFKLHEKREQDFENPVLGLRDTLVFRMARPRTEGE
jgi:RimJ/RimL family protein N-acetyltransferase